MVTRCFKLSHVPVHVAVWQKLSHNGSRKVLDKPSCSRFWEQGREGISFYFVKWPLATPFSIFFLKKQCDDTGISVSFHPDKQLLPFVTFQAWDKSTCLITVPKSPNPVTRLFFPNAQQTEFHVGDFNRQHFHIVYSLALT